jgi:hypothetical protein
VLVVWEPNIGIELLVDVPKSDGLGASWDPVVELVVPSPPKMLMLVGNVAGDVTVLSAGLVWLPKPPKNELGVAAGAAALMDEETLKRLDTAEVVVVVVALLPVDAPVTPKYDKDGGWLLKLNLEAGSVGSAGLVSAGVLPNENGNVEVEGFVGA